MRAIIILTIQNLDSGSTEIDTDVVIDCAEAKLLFIASK